MRKAMVLCALLAAANAAVAADPKGPPFPRIANCYGVGLRPDSIPKDIEEIARFDLLIGGVWCNWDDAAQREKLAANMSAVRKLNPHIIILDFSSSAPYAQTTDKTFPENGWLLQPNGNRIEGWPGTRMINLTKPDVIDWLVARSVRSVRERGFDGSFIDCMGPGFDWWACNIEGGQAYEVDANGDRQPDDRKQLDETWLSAKTELARRVREALGPNTVFMTNGPDEYGLPTMNGKLFEDWLDYVLEGRMRWDHVIEKYLPWTQTQHAPNVTTIVSSSGIEPPYEAWTRMKDEERNAMLDRGRNLRQRMRFGLATTLMGDGYYAYDLHTRWRGQRWWYPEYDAPLGYPKGPAEKQPDGTWRREFDGGAVIVNPTCLDASFTFANRRKDMSSDKVDTQFIVPADDGRIFIPTEAAIASGKIPDPSHLFTAEGKEAIVQRGDRLLCRLKGAVAIFDPQGRLLQMTDGGHILLQGMAAVLVKVRWRDIRYEDCRIEMLSGDGARFTGRRAQDDVALEYQSEVRVKEGALHVTTNWKALTAGELAMFRHRVEFPVAEFAGGLFIIGGNESPLPVDRSAEPMLSHGFRSITLVPADGPSVYVETSQDAILMDQRHYGQPAYLLAVHAPSCALKPGDAWTCSFTIRVE
ncbi:MAG: putative glycoside hydrolase [Planctomycetota bacterium]